MAIMLNEENYFLWSFTLTRRVLPLPFSVSQTLCEKLGRVGSPLMAASMSHSDRSMPLRDSFSERMEGTGSWNAHEWTKIEPVLQSISYTNLEFLIEAEQVIMEVQTLTSPSKEEFSKLLEAYKPNLVYLQGERLGNDEVGPLVWGDVDLSNP